MISGGEGGSEGGRGSGDGGGGTWRLTGAGGDDGGCACNRVGSD